MLQLIKYYEFGKYELITKFLSQ